jgi:hypothetical protein
MFVERGFFIVVVGKREGWGRSYTNAQASTDAIAHTNADTNADTGARQRVKSVNPT